LSASETQGQSVLVPVSDTSTASETVRYAVESAGDAEIHVVSVVSRFRKREGKEGGAEKLLEKARVWAEEANPDASVRFEVLETNSYLFGPGEHAEVFAEYAAENGVGRVILDPNYRVNATSPRLQPLTDEIRRYEGLTVELAPVQRPTRTSQLLTRGGVFRFALLFLLSYGFYLSLSSFKPFDLITGGATALVVAATLRHVSFETSPSPSRLPRLAARLVFYAVYLGWEIIVANFRIAYVVLHPNLPIDPSVEKFEAAVWGGAAVTTLANSITLTPGTLTVEANGRVLHVHSLTSDARDGLLEGSIERGVRFLFYGREAMDYPKPKERGEKDD
jgi:multicomponent Na+:H+ antiporter subunit E